MKKKNRKFTLKNKRLRKVIPVVLGIGLVLLVVGFVGYRYVYSQNLKALSSEKNGVELAFTVEPGSSVKVIASNLESKKLIKADWAFERYVKSHGLSSSLKAGTFKLNSSYSVEQIASIISEGKVAVDLFTIFPAQRLDQIRTSMIEKGGFSAADVDAALKPEQYASHPALANKPAGSSLEGYLYPDSYQRVAETKPSDIIRSALDQMAVALSPEVKSGIAAQGISVHEAVILASIVEKEIPANPLKLTEDRQKAAQVFLKRKALGMKLGSDVTACYGAITAGAMKTGDNCDDFVYFDSAYNTRIKTGLPPGPISNVSKSSLQAIASPASTGYLYFVAGADCVTRFSNTNEEHEALVQKYGLSTQGASCN